MLFYILLFCCSCNSIFQISFCKKRLWTLGKGHFIKCLIIVIVIIIVVVVIVMTMIIKWSASSFNMPSTPGQNVHLVVSQIHAVASSSHLANSSSQLVVSSSLS